MNNWTSQPMGQHGIAMPSFDNYEDSAALSFETHFDDSYDEKSWSDPYEMTLGEFYGRLKDGQYDSSDAEFLQFVPALLSALPTVVQGVSRVIPRVAQGVSSVVNSFSRPRQAPPPRPSYRPVPTNVAPPQPTAMAPARPMLRPFPARPAPAAPAPAPAPQVTPAPPQQVSPAPGVDNSTLATLLALLSDPGLQSAVQTATGNASIPIGGNSNLPVSAVMDIIGQLAGAVTGNEVPASQEAYPDFLFDSYGNALVNLDSAEEVGNLLLDRIQYS